MEVLQDGKFTKPILDFSIFTPDKEHDEKVLKEREELEKKEFFELVKKTMIPERYYTSTFNNYTGNETQVNQIMQYAEKTARNYNGILVILGGYGTGKTHLACACLHTNTNGRYIDMPTLEIEIECSRDFSAKENKASVLEKYIKPSLLVIDEIGRFQNPIAEKQALYYIINARYNKKLSTVLVSNFNQKEFGEYVGNATTDRIAEKRILIELKGESYRQSHGEKETV